MRRIALLGLFVAAACAPRLPEAENLPAVEGEAPVEAMIEALPNLGPAPELHNDTWLNTDHPLRLAELRGQVVLIDMWTFG